MCTQDISQVIDAISQTKNEEHWREIEIKRNRDQEQKANRKHKYLFRGSSHRSTPHLHRREGFPLSTEDFTRSYRRPEYRTPPLTSLFQRGISTRVTKGTSNQVITTKITNSLQHFSFTTPYRMRMEFWL